MDTLLGTFSCNYDDKVAALAGSSEIFILYTRMVHVVIILYRQGNSLAYP